MREEGSYTGEEFLERKKEIEEEILRVKIDSDDLGTDNFDIEKTLAYARNFIEKMKTYWFEMPPQIKFKFYNLLFPEGIWYQNNSSFGTTDLGVVLKLNQAFSGAKSQEKSQLVDLLRSNWKCFIRELREWEEVVEVV